VYVRPIESPEHSLKSQQDAIYREKVERARRMTIGERLSAGPELFEEAMGRMKIGIRLQHPEADEQEVTRLLVDQMERLKAWKEREIYRQMEPVP